MASPLYSTLFDNLTRLVSVVSGLQSGPITLRDLAKRANVTIRTIQRDFGLLRRLGAPLVFSADGYTPRLPRRWNFWMALQTHIGEQGLIKTKAARSRTSRGRR